MKKGRDTVGRITVLVLLVWAVLITPKEHFWITILLMAIANILFVIAEEHLNNP